MSFKMGLLARKLGMTQVFHDDGTALGCTALQVGPCIVTAQRTPEKHGMKGMTRTHGTHEYFRHGGSIGCRLTPQRVHKGKRMSGHMGAEQVTIQNLQLFRVLAEEGCILVRGAVPGAPNEYVIIHKAATRDAYKRKGVGKEEVRSKNPLKASKKAAAGRG